MHPQRNTRFAFLTWQGFLGLVLLFHWSFFHPLLLIRGVVFFTLSFFFFFFCCRIDWAGLCFVVINPRVLLTDRVDFGLSWFHNVSNFTPPPRLPSSTLPIGLASYPNGKLPTWSCVPPLSVCQRGFFEKGYGDYVFFCHSYFSSQRRNSNVHSLKSHTFYLTHCHPSEKPPNLGGLARTCEIFGARSLTVHNLAVKTQTAFLAPSVSAHEVCSLLNLSLIYNTTRGMLAAVEVIG